MGSEMCIRDSSHTLHGQRGTECCVVASFSDPMSSLSPESHADGVRLVRNRQTRHNLVIVCIPEPVAQRPRGHASFQVYSSMSLSGFYRFRPYKKREASPWVTGDTSVSRATAYASCRDCITLTCLLFCSTAYYFKLSLNRWHLSGDESHGFDTSLQQQEDCIAVITASWYSLYMVTTFSLHVTQDINRHLINVIVCRYFMCIVFSVLCPWTHQITMVVYQVVVSCFTICYRYFSALLLSEDIRYETRTHQITMVVYQSLFTG